MLLLLLLLIVVPLCANVLNLSRSKNERGCVSVALLLLLLLATVDAGTVGLLKFARDFSSICPLRKAEILAAISLAEEGALAVLCPEPLLVLLLQLLLPPLLAMVPLVMLPALFGRTVLDAEERGAEEEEEAEEEAAEGVGTGVGRANGAAIAFSFPAERTS